MQGTTTVAARARMRRATTGQRLRCKQRLTAALVAQSCMALALVVAVTAAAEAKKLRATAEAGRGNEKGVQSQNPFPPLIGLTG